MDINELKSKIEDILDEIEKGQYSIAIINKDKLLPVILLLITENRTIKANLEEMKKAIGELESENKIIVLSPDLISLKLMNQMTGTETTPDRIFVHSRIIKANEELLRVYRKV
ncbi:MAG: hypothetical protein WC431_00430 [Candidatus Omnitrophota bacterium]